MLRGYWQWRSRFMNNSLKGLRILDLTSYLSGPFATWTLAGLGAEVWKIERKDGGDPAREFPPFAGRAGNALRELTSKDDESIAILKRNRGKKSISMNLDTDEGRKLLLRLVKVADVLIENIAPGVLEKWGLGHDVLLEANPRLVMCSISGYGRTGERSKLPAFDPIVQASALTMATNGDPQQAPTRTGISFGDTVPALYAVIGILAALRKRDQTGEGSVVDISMHDALVAMLMIEPVEAQIAWGLPLRTGSSISRLVPCNVYACKGGGYVALNAAPPRLWKRLAREIGREDLLDPQLEPLARRLERYEWLDGIVADWVAGQTIDEVLEQTSKAGVPCARVLETLDELVLDPANIAKGLLEPVEHPELGTIDGIYAPRLPIVTRGQQGATLCRAPRLGEHTKEVLREALGLTDTEIHTLQIENIV